MSEEPQAKRQKMDDFTQRRVGIEFERLLRRCGHSDAAFRGLTYREAYLLIRSSWTNAKLSYEDALKGAALPYWSESFDMLTLLLCGFDEEFKGDSAAATAAVRHLYHKRSEFLCKFLEVYETGQLRTPVDVSELVSLGQDVVITKQPQLFLRLVKRGQVIVTPQMLLTAINQSLEGRELTAGTSPMHDFDVAKELLDWAPEDGYAVRVFGAERLRYHRVKNAFGELEIKECHLSKQTLGDILAVCVKDSTRDLVAPHFDYLRRTLAVYDAYMDCLLRLMAYRTRLASYIHTTTTLLPVLCFVVTSYLVPA